MSKSWLFSRKWRAVALFMLAMSALNGCGNVNILQGIRLSLNESSTPSLNRPIAFVLEGKGSCQGVNVDWGDGTIERVDALPGPRFELETIHLEDRSLFHTFTGWGGGKTVTAEGVGCLGKVRLRFNTSPSELKIGWAQPAPPGTSGVCQTATNLPGMIPRMLVKASLPTISSARDIDFGCFAAGCVFNADGKSGSVADASFPFPGLKEYSVVFRIGPQIVQGGTNMQFTTTASGPLELCLNDGDKDLTNNRGGFAVTISVDQLGP
jgi:hypothetical protein